mmetsp:Transcript_2357/g.6513  ORF Transcript_2357/g.6513 Transcript_2357/m.6513 type:complete len:207 (+) Transcript_2357:232-852(+)
MLMPHTTSACSSYGTSCKASRRWLSHVAAPSPAASDAMVDIADFGLVVCISTSPPPNSAWSSCEDLGQSVRSYGDHLADTLMNISVLSSMRVAQTARTIFKLRKVNTLEYRAAPKTSPIDVMLKYSARMSTCILSGACAYANSNPVTLTKISAIVMMVICGTCQATCTEDGGWLWMYTSSTLLAANDSEAMYMPYFIRDVGDMSQS